MAKKSVITVKDVNIRTMTVNGIDYICITDIAWQKNETEPKDVVKNWMRQKNTLEYLGLWERLHNPNFKGDEFDPLLAEAGSNAFTMSPTKWVELTAAIGILTKNGDGGRAGAVGCRQPTAARGNLQRSHGFGSRPHYRKHVIGHEFLMSGVWECRSSRSLDITFEKSSSFRGFGKKAVVNRKVQIPTTIMIFFLRIYLSFVSCRDTS